MFNKKAQISDTMTWMVATIIIVVILTISILIVSGSNFLFGDIREFQTKQTDLLVTKSFMGYLLSDDIYNGLKDESGYPSNPNFRLDSYKTDLANKIFPILYSNGVNDKQLWIGIVNKSSVFGLGTLVKSDPFGMRNAMSPNDKSDWRSVYTFIELDNQNILELIVKKKI